MTQRADQRRRALVRQQGTVVRQYLADQSGKLSAVESEGAVEAVDQSGHQWRKNFALVGPGPACGGGLQQRNDKIVERRNQSRRHVPGRRLVVIPVEFGRVVVVWRIADFEQLLE